MKRKIFKIMIAIMLLTTLTMSNFVYVGASIISYAAEATETNHKNIQFSSNLKDNKTLELQISVNKEGYFNGNIALGNTNFKLKSLSNPYVYSIKENNITLNQINAGTTAKIEVEIEPMKEEVFEIGLLNMESEINLTGIYKNSTQKDIEIKATRKVSMSYVENNTQETLENNLEVLTNTLKSVKGQNKRIVQVAWNLGLKNNDYPIKEIYAKLGVPTIDGEKPEVVKLVKLNTMTHYDYKYDGSNVEITMTNEPNDKGLVSWKKQGNETVILSFIYSEKAKIENLEISGEEKLTLYNQKELNSLAKTKVIKEKDAIVDITTSALESEILKGKIQAGIERKIQTTTNVEVRLAEAIENIRVLEKSAKYANDSESIDANITFDIVKIGKEEFYDILGQNGEIKILNENKEVVGIINAESQSAETNFLETSCKGAKELTIEISRPNKEGNLNFIYSKTIHKTENINISDVNKIINQTILETQPDVKEKITQIKLKDSKTEATFEVNRDTLSTVVANEVEIKVVLQSNHERYNLYKNPQITIALPEQVENIQINNVNMLYEDELKIKDYGVDGKNIIIELEGEQTKYKEATVTGTNIIINANLTMNKKSASSEEKILMTCYNENSISGNVEVEKNIRIVAPKDITLINNIPSMQIETMGKEETKNIIIQKGAEARIAEIQIEVINNNEDEIENVSILGTFPTNTNNGNLNISIINGINLVEAIEGAKIYYTDNANATEDINNKENGWNETIQNPVSVAKYLITIPKVESQSSIQGSYTIQIPENLEYNQKAQQSYQVKYTNSITKIQNTMGSTTIEIETGIGPKLETKMIAKIGNKELQNSDEVKNGEIISYQIQVSNIGTQDIASAQVIANVPEGTTMVVPEEHYEYTGASYYKELDSKEYNTTIENLKVGEVVTKTYEVRVNNNTKIGTELTNKAKVKYLEAIKESAEIKNIVKEGKITATVKRVTDRNIELYAGQTVQYFAMIENITNEKQDNVKVITNLSDNLRVDRLTCITGMKKEEIHDDIYFVVSGQESQIEEIVEEDLQDETNSEIIEYKEEINIGSLEPGEIKVLSYDLYIENTEKQEIDFSVSVKQGKEQYTSNGYKEEVKQTNVSVAMTASVDNKYVTAGDIIEYTIKIKNNANTELQGIILKDSIPTQLTIQKVTIGDEIIEELDSNELEMPCEVQANGTTTVKVEAIVDYSESREEAETFTNIAHVELLGEKVASTSEISHIIQANEGSAADSNTSNNIVEDNDIATGNKMISGVAWFDKNTNGQKEQGEELLANIKVKLLNADTNNFVKNEDGQVIEVTTNENGMYVFNNIGNGNYIVIFDYDNSKYTVTKYKVNGVSESENSDVMKNELTIEGQPNIVTSTDIIKIQNNNISDINIGIIKLQNFDLALNKYVNKIIIQNASGTTSKEYNNQTLAKAELDGKKINGTTVIIEYAIIVTNNGEIDGYAKKIADYLPSDLKFSSELNKDWYQTGETLYNASLANEVIKAGESKTITLTVTKAMNENNTGRINNTAEIVEDFNELGINDTNSQPGNRASGENDTGMADVILSIKTGGVIIITAVIIIVIALAVGATIIIINKNKNKNEKTKDK